MSTSLLVALLEAHEPDEPDRSRDYFNWIGAYLDGREWIGGLPEREELMRRELYDVLQSTMNVTSPARGWVDTILARTLTDDPREGLQEAARQLRATLRSELLKRFDGLVVRYPPQKKTQEAQTRWPSDEQSKATTVLYVQEVSGYARAHPLQSQDKALHINCGGRPFALMYVTPEAHTVAWEGIVAFDRLEDEVTDALKALGKVDVTLRQPAVLNQTSVAFVFSRTEDSDELVKYHLGVNTEFTSYTQTMKDPGTISFARYDFSNFFFSFIAENAALQQGFESEVALKLPRQPIWTEALLEWVIRHHRHYNLLIQEVAREPSVAILNQQLAP